MSAADLAALDRFIATSTPALVVPHAGGVGDLETSGPRYLLAQDGVHAQFRRRWVKGSILVAPSRATLPFGVHSAGIDLLCGRVPASLVRQFAVEARRRLPNEVAAWITWSPAAQGQAARWELRILESLHATAGHVRFERPTLPSGEHLVLDIHSHGRLPAFFSGTDDEDDSDVSVVKIAAVLGNVDGAVSTTMRLCACGAFQHIGELNEILNAAL